VPPATFPCIDSRSPEAHFVRPPERTCCCSAIGFRAGVETRKTAHRRKINGGGGFCHKSLRSPPGFQRPANHIFYACNKNRLPMRASIRRRLRRMAKNANRPTYITCCGASRRCRSRPAAEGGGRMTLMADVIDERQTRRFVPSNGGASIAYGITWHCVYTRQRQTPLPIYARRMQRLVRRASEM
jgi:hypothetical protein